ncbi:TIGR03086 family metal-binding protein [Jatrophihabitans sp.]|uniref:TIGR03086 family metal-binding protein n=1 Tax=Jatrophihabitans sp. TaxID=1932789 RepID=UPI0030C6CB32|nr:hypothetical protein [Jatrophihabitans sp.]
MDEILAMFLTGTSAFDDRVHAITPDQWQAETPDDDWSVADLVSHLIDEHRWLPPLLHGLDLSSAGLVVEGTRSLPVDGGVGANLAESWDEAVGASRDAVVEEAALERSVDLSRGPTPARQYLLEMTVDLAIHSWDLGRAIGYSEPLPADLVDFVYSEVSSWGDASGSGFFGAPVQVPDDASTIDKLVAATGRDPR